MRTVSFIPQQGDADKPTLAVAAEAAGLCTVVIDLDHQASAKGWHDHHQMVFHTVI